MKQERQFSFEISGEIYRTDSNLYSYSFQTDSDNKQIKFLYN